MIRPSTLQDELVRKGKCGRKTKPAVIFKGIAKLSDIRDQRSMSLNMTLCCGAHQLFRRASSADGKVRELLVDVLVV